MYSATGSGWACSSRGRPHGLGGALTVGGEVVVGEEDRAVARRVQLLQLVDDPRRRLVALLAAEIDDHVAELALEWTAATGLHDAELVAARSELADGRHGRRLQIDRLRRAVLLAPVAAAKIVEEGRPGRFGLADEQDVGVRPHHVRRQAGVRPADRHPPPARLNSSAISHMRRIWVR